MAAEQQGWSYFVDQRPRSVIADVAALDGSFGDRHLDCPALVKEDCPQGHGEIGMSGELADKGRGHRTLASAKYVGEFMQQQKLVLAKTSGVRVGGAAVVEAPHCVDHQVELAGPPAVERGLARPGPCSHKIHCYGAVAVFGEQFDHRGVDRVLQDLAASPRDGRCVRRPAAATGRRGETRRRKGEGCRCRRRSAGRYGTCRIRRYVDCRVRHRYPRERSVVGSAAGDAKVLD